MAEKEIKGSDLKVVLYKQKQTIDEMEDNSLLSFLDDRFNDMKTASIREAQELIRDQADKQFTALSMRDQYGNLKVNLPMEQNLIDTYEGRASGKIIFDIQPDGKQADVDELQPAQYATEFYLEGWDNRGSGFYDEAPIMRRNKARYGTMFSFIGIENDRQLKYRIKKDAEIVDVASLENKDNYEPYMLDSWELFPKDINIRSVYVDEKVLNQTDLQNAEDLFIEKVMSLDKINFIRGKISWYKWVASLTESTLSEQQKKNKDEFARNQVVIRFYYNALSKDYIIYAPNDQIVIHRSKMLYNHGRLPIESCQHYSDDNCLYGIGIPLKIKYLKGFKSEIMQSILDSASQSSWLNFIIWWWWEIEDWNLWGNGINVWRTAVGAEQIKQLQPQVNGGLVAILNVLDDLVVQDTGENVRSTIDMQTDKVGIVEMMEENKAIRHKSVDGNWNMFLDRSLSMMLSNIAQFLPTLMSKTTTYKQWEEEMTKIEYPYIRIKDAVVESKWGKKIINSVDNKGKLWYFEMKPWSISGWLGVKVVTPSTTSSLPMIKKDNITKRIDNKLKLTELASLDQTGEMMSEVRRTINIEEVNQWMNDVYWFEDKIKSKTGKDKIRELNKKKVEEIREKMEALKPMQSQTPILPTTQSDGQTPINAMTGSPEATQSVADPMWIQGAGAGEATPQM